jgi:transposase
VTTLFAALNVLDGSVISCCQNRHRHTEWLKFLKQIDKSVEPGLQIHVVLDNYATHKHAKVREWLAKHPRFHMHFTATSASWMNMVERFFRSLSEDRLKRGVFPSLGDLITAIEQYVATHNEHPKPFVWTKDARDILQKVIRARGKLEMVQTA